jgi:hypothetical protein
MGDVRAAAPALLVVGDVVELRRQESMPQAV